MTVPRLSHEEQLRELEGIIALILRVTEKISAMPHRVRRESNAIDKPRDEPPSTP